MPLDGTYAWMDIIEGSLPFGIVKWNECGIIVGIYVTLLSFWASPI